MATRRDFEKQSTWTMVILAGDDHKVYEMGNMLKRDVNTNFQQVEATNTMGIGEKLDGLHLINFMESIRGKEKLNCPISTGHTSTLLPQLGNIAYRTS